MSNEDIVRDIIENYDGDNITKKAIKEELEKRGVEVEKDELKEIINKIQSENESE